jgi:hypothetical protein
MEMSVKVHNSTRTQLYTDNSISSAVFFHFACELEPLMEVASLITDAEGVRYAYVVAFGSATRNCPPCLVKIV